MKISYAITVCNELEEISRLLEKLVAWITLEDEICVLVDKPKASDSLLNLLYEYSSKNLIVLKESIFNGNFSDWKNELTELCDGEYIFQIDADEEPCKTLVENLTYIVYQGADVILVPRVNTVEGITEEHIRKWGWIVDDNQRINWPDYQWRIYRNVPRIKWINKVHERLDGFASYALLPQEEEYALYHKKDIERQEKQNNYYDTL